MNKTTKISVMAEVSRPDKNYNFFGDLVPYKGKLYWVDLANEIVEFREIIKEGDKDD